MKRLFLVVSLVLSSVGNCFSAAAPAPGHPNAFTRGTYQLVLNDGTVTVTTHFVDQCKTLADLAELSTVINYRLPVPTVKRAELGILQDLVHIETPAAHLAVLNGFTLDQLIKLWKAANTLDYKKIDLIEAAVATQVSELNTRHLAPENHHALAAADKQALEIIDGNQSLKNAVIDILYQQPFKIVTTINRLPRVKNLTYSPNGQKFAVTTRNTTLKIFNALTQTETHRVILGTPIDKLYFKNNHELCYLSPAGKFFTRNLTTRTSRPAINLFPRGDGIFSFHYLNVSHQTGQFALELEEIVNIDSTLKAYSHNGRELFSIPTNDDEDIYDILYNPDGTKIVVLFDASDNTELRVFDARTGQLERTIQSENTFHLLSFTPDGKKLLIAVNGDTLQILNFETGNVINSIRNAYRNRTVGNFFSPDGEFITIIDEGNQAPHTVLKTWNLRSGKLVSNQPLEGTFNYFYKNPTQPQLAAYSTHSGHVVIFENKWKVETINEAYEQSLLKMFERPQ